MNEIAVSRTITAIDKLCAKNSCMIDFNAADIHSALAEEPNELWDKSKHDVGLMKGYNSVVIELWYFQF